MNPVMLAIALLHRVMAGPGGAAREIPRPRHAARPPPAVLRRQASARGRQIGPRRLAALLAGLHAIPPSHRHPRHLRAA